MPIPDVYFNATVIEMELDAQGVEKGVRYKVYKGAVCGKVVSAKTSKSNLPQIDPVTEAASIKIIMEKHLKCKKSKYQSTGGPELSTQFKAKKTIYCQLVTVVGIKERLGI
jgi:hypothetical protein